MSWWEAAVLGLVQGLTEFLPISSSAHIRVIGPLLPHGGDPGAAFTAIIQLGTEAAVLLYFRHDIARIVTSWLRALRGADGSDRAARFGAKNADARLGWWVILGSIPIVVLGVLFKDAIESSVRNLYITATVLAVFGVVLGWVDRVRPVTRELDTLRARDAVLAGFRSGGGAGPGSVTFRWHDHDGAVVGPDAICGGTLLVPAGHPGGGRLRVLRIGDELWRPDRGRWPGHRGDRHRDRSWPLAWATS